MTSSSTSGDPNDTSDVTAENDDNATLATQLEAAQAELNQLREDTLRERAELENQRKRMTREIDMARKFANERLLAELLPVIDSLEAGLAVQADTAAHLREGMELTLRQLLKVAGDNGLVAVDPVGQPFDPDKHQAMSMVEPTGHAPGDVVQVYQKGWLLNERLLRPALVVVARHD